MAKHRTWWQEIYISQHNTTHISYIISFQYCCRFFHLITKVWWREPSPRVVLLFVHGRWTGTHTRLLYRCDAVSYILLLYTLLDIEKFIFLNKCIKIDSHCFVVAGKCDFLKKKFFFTAVGKRMLMPCVIVWSGCTECWLPHWSEDGGVSEVNWCCCFGHEPSNHPTWKPRL